MSARERLELVRRARRLFEVLSRRAPELLRSAGMAGALFALDSLLGGEVLYAATPPVRATFELSGPTDCNDAPRFAREVERRSDVVLTPNDEDAQARVGVVIASSEAGYEASVLIRRSDGAESRRVISGSSCGEVIEGAALIVAVALQPPRAPPRPPSRPPPRPRVEPRPAPEAAQGQAKDVEEAEAGWRWGGGTQGSVATGIAPAPIAGVEIFADARSERAGLAPALRLGVRHATRSGLALPLGRAAFRLDAATFSLCPVHLRPASALSVRPCATGVVGRLQASGSGLSVSLSDRHPWFSAGLSLRFDVRVLRMLVLELEGGSEVALARGTFRVDDREMHRTSRFGARAALGLVASF